MPAELLIITVTTLIGSIIGGLITFLGMRSSSVIGSVPKLITALGDRVDSQAKEIEKYEKRLKKFESQLQDVEKRYEERIGGLEREIGEWKGNYFKLLRWLKSFFRRHNIDDQIPKFHKDQQEESS